MFDASQPTLPWTAEREARALRLFLCEGFTATEVADALGGVTRAAVIGKVRRLGFFKRDGAPTPKCVLAPVRERGVDRRLPPKRTPRPIPPLREVPPTGKACRLACLPTGACRWPIDDPGPSHMHTVLFCAGEATDGVYCAAHRTLAHAR